MGAAEDKISYVVVHPSIKETNCSPEILSSSRPTKVLVHGLSSICVFAPCVDVVRKQCSQQNITRRGKLD